MHATNWICTKQRISIFPFIYPGFTTIFISLRGTANYPWGNQHCEMPTGVHSIACLKISTTSNMVSHEGKSNLGQASSCQAHHMCRYVLHAASVHTLLWTRSQETNDLTVCKVISLDCRWLITFQCHYSCSNWDEPAQQGEGIMEESNKYGLGKTTISPGLEMGSPDHPKKLRMALCGFSQVPAGRSKVFLTKNKFKADIQCNPEIKLSYKYTPSSLCLCTARVCLWAGYMSLSPVTRNEERLTGTSEVIHTWGRENLYFVGVSLPQETINRKTRERFLMENMIAEQPWCLG